MQELLKYQKNIKEIPYIIGIDLALYRTGVCVYHPSTDTFTDLEEVQVPHETDIPMLILCDGLSNYFERITAKYGNGGMVVQEAMPAQAGPHSTISTLQALAKAHGILELCVCLHDGLYRYDKTGVYSVSVKSIFKTEETPKPTKQDIQARLIELYDCNFDGMSENISDAMGVVYTLINRKWNNDIKERQKEIKREIKSLKAQHAIDAHQKEIERLQALMI